MKKLVICCDGTWSRADQGEPTNVVKLAYRVSKRDQVLFYDQGVGTGNSLDRLFGGAFGHGLADNVFDAYRFLIANYEAGDQIFLFGFSRGAYTVRSLAGMIRKCGILRRDAVEYYTETLRLYRDADTHPDHPEAQRHRDVLSVTPDIPIQFLGVWDTVGALGIPIRGLRWLSRRKYQFHDTELSAAVRNAAHAVAIDERRAPFTPTLWKPVPKNGQVVKQLWFPGVHSDVGGGYKETGLSDCTLEWMMGRASEAGLIFDESMPRLKADACGPIHDSRKGIYWWIPGKDREITSSEDVHYNAIYRWAMRIGYWPRALRRLMKR